MVAKWRRLADVNGVNGVNGPKEKFGRIPLTAQCPLRQSDRGRSQLCHGEATANLRSGLGSLFSAANGGSFGGRHNQW